MEKNNINEEINSIKYLFGYQKGVVISEQGGKQLLSKFAGGVQRVATAAQNVVAQAKTNRSPKLDAVATQARTYADTLLKTIQKGNEFISSLPAQTKTATDKGYEKEAEALNTQIQALAQAFNAFYTQLNTFKENAMTYHEKVNPQQQTAAPATDATPAAAPVTPGATAKAPVTATPAATAPTK
jgi:uncharacterized protein YukE